ncbi:MAG: zf-TFIIB domain-containing protein [Gammaproteobacteria bacterium]|nr:zf-TFIIB domain-containing protein [Gammaproteobacteria bacterium]
MKCPKCHTGDLAPVNYSRAYTVHRCNNCHCLWFPEESYKALKKEWMSQAALDIGDPKIGRELNKLKNIKSPVTGKVMKTVIDERQPHIQYEVDVDGYGALFDPGEFTDYVEENISDFFQSFMANVKQRKDSKVKSDSASVVSVVVNEVAKKAIRKKIAKKTIKKVAVAKKKITKKKATNKKTTKKKINQKKSVTKKKGAKKLPAKKKVIKQRSVGKIIAKVAKKMIKKTAKKLSKKPAKNISKKSVQKKSKKK